jgi:quercetin dioxygenase-like cupin family protein
MRLPRLLSLAACVLIGSAPAPAGAEFVIIKPEQLEWQDVPEREGLEVAFLVGHPGKPGLYAMRVRFAPGVMSRPHTHDRDRHVTVIEGTWYAGTQRSFDPEATVALAPGSFMLHPAGAVHYDGARDERVIVEIRGMGPVSTDYVDLNRP